MVQVLLGAGAVSADLPFASGFESGRPCDWAGGEGLCLTEDEMAAGLAGDYPVCVPPSTQPIAGIGTAVVCGQSQCASGAPGCDAMVHVTGATFTLATSTAGFGATLEDDVFPTRVTVDFPPATHDCDLNLTDGTATGVIDFTTAPACFAPLVEVAAVPGATVDLEVTLAFSDCAIAGLLNALLPGMQGQILADAEAQVAELVRAAAEAAWVGRWVCPGP